MLAVRGKAIHGRCPLLVTCGTVLAAAERATSLRFAVSAKAGGFLGKPTVAPSRYGQTAVAGEGPLSSTGANRMRAGFVFHRVDLSGVLAPRTAAYKSTTGDGQSRLAIPTERAGIVCSSNDFKRPVPRVRPCCPRGMQPSGRRPAVASARDCKAASFHQRRPHAHRAGCPRHRRRRVSGSW